MSTLSTLPIHRVSSSLYWLGGGPLSSLPCFMASRDPALRLPSGCCVRHKVWSTPGSLDEQIWTGLAQKGGQRTNREERVPSPTAGTCFYTVCASDFVGKGNSAPKIKIDLIELPVGKTETRRVNGLPDIQGSGVAQPGQNPGFLKRTPLSPSQWPEMTVSSFVS